MQARLAPLFLVIRGTADGDEGVAELWAELWALGAIEVYHLLVCQRGWSPDRYRDWLVELCANRLLAEPG